MVDDNFTNLAVKRRYTRGFSRLLIVRRVNTACPILTSDSFPTAIIRFGLRHGDIRNVNYTVLVTFYIHFY